MIRNATIIGLCAVVVALPFLFRRAPEVSDWSQGDPRLVIISPHNEAIRYEFSRAFSAWHHRRYGQPVKVDWRAIGGTSEIMRYLAAEYVASFRAWRRQSGGAWPEDGGAMILDRRFDPRKGPPADADRAGRNRWERQRELYEAFRGTDDSSAFTATIDLFFGGGAYDHGKAFKQGLTVPPWPPGHAPDNTVATTDGRVLVPLGLSGETWRNDGFFGAVVSTFGICYNADRLRELGIRHPPDSWSDLSDPAYFRQLGVADPTKSGSITKAFEMIIHEQCDRAVREAGFRPGQVAEFERRIGEARLAPGELPGNVPPEYQRAVESGWLAGVRLVQRIAANARYFTDSAGKVPIDVSVGNAAAGLAIDFYGRYQAEVSASPEGVSRMAYVTPVGGSSVSADPISLLRGAEHRELAVRFIVFVLSEDGQKLWTYAPGTPGGPAKFALRRLPIRRDFYPSEDPDFDAAFRRHSKHSVDELGDPNVNPYEVAGRFTYHPRWTAGHFSAHRYLIRAMCLDAGEELRAAWQSIIENGGPGAQPEAMAVLERMPTAPEPLNWRSILEITRTRDNLDYMREWTMFFRERYREAKRVAGA